MSAAPIRDGGGSESFGPAASLCSHRAALKQILIVKTGSSFPGLVAAHGDFEEWIGRAAGIPPERLRVARVAEGETLPPPADVAAAVVTGSSAMVSDRAPWSERTARWLAFAVGAGTPVLGICYGHQLLAHSLGGAVGRNPRGRQVGTVAVDLTPAARTDALLGGLPARLTVQATHVESVLSLPPGARLLARTPADPHHAFAVGACAWGVQFHPEFDAELMRAYLDERREIIESEGIDVDALRGATADSDHGARVLRRFAERIGA